MVAGDVNFFLLLKMIDLNKLTSKLELWRRECLILVNISMFCNCCKNLLTETYLQSF